MEQIVAYSACSGGCSTDIAQLENARVGNGIIRNMYDHDFSGYPPDRQAHTLWHYLVFPIDAWRKGETDAYFEAQKADEIWPMMVFLLPGIVLVAAFGLALGFFSSLLFYGFEAALLAIVCKFYAALDTLEQVTELFLNFWMALVLQAFCFMLLFGFFSVFV